MRNTIKLLAAAAIAGSAAIPAQAGEITGPSGSGDPIERHGRSVCSYSGLNDTPLGSEEDNDPGGIVQSFGYFMKPFGIPNASVFDPHVDYVIPGYSCNPNRGGEEYPPA